MKTFRKGILGAIALLLFSHTSSFAIEGLHVSLQSSNAVLSWPSDPSEIYVVQYRDTLASTDSWVTLTSSLPGATDTNITFFVHSNSVQYPVIPGGGTNSGGGFPDPTGTNNTSGGGTNIWSATTGFYLVVRDGVYLLNSSLLTLTNGALSNMVNIAFEAGNAASDGTGTNVLGNVVCADLRIDGTKFAGNGVLGSPTNSSPWQFSMDTAYLENGDHTFQVEVTWMNPDNSDGNHVNITRQSAPITITVSNAIYYPQWEPEIGEAGISAYFLKTTCTDADWHIDIYDASNRLAQTLNGHTDDGTIEAYWNMVDTNGVTRTNADLDPEFNAIVTVADPITKTTPPKTQRAKNWPDHGTWVIAYQDYFKFEYSANNRQKGSINVFANTAAKYGGYYLYYPQSGDTNDTGQTYPLRYQKVNHPDTNITSVENFLDEQKLRMFLSNTNSRNFYYDGHGTANFIVSPNLNTTLLKTETRYRFVMLNSCSSAKGNLDAAFGINGPGHFTQTYYHDTGIRPGAFCGYNEDVPYNDQTPRTVNGVDYDDTIPDDVPFFITNFLLYWDFESGRLTDAIDYARDNLPHSGGYQNREDHWEIHGYDALRIDEFNHGSDTW